jgi:hypothetical protein
MRVLGKHLTLISATIEEAEELLPEKRGYICIAQSDDTHGNSCYVYRLPRSAKVE